MDCLSVKLQVTIPKWVLQFYHYSLNLNSISIIKIGSKKKPQNVRGMACASGKPHHQQQEDKSSHKTSDETFRGNFNTKT